MPFPDTYALVHVARNTEISAAVLNELQRQQILAWLAVRGGDFLVDDEFVGGSVDAAKWATIGGATTTADDGAGAMGSLQLVGPNAVVSTRSLDFGVRDLRFTARARISGLPVGGAARIGLSAGSLNFDAVQTAANWRGNVGGVITDLGVAWDTAYHLFEIWREAGSVRFVIDGVQRHSVAHASALITGIELAADGAGTGLRVDRCKAWASQYPSIGLPTGPPFGRIAHDGIAIFTNQDTVAVTFPVAFAATAYRLGVGSAVVTDGGGAVSLDVTGKATTGFTIRASHPFSGEVSWWAYL